jgi:hypothetical protein
VLLPSFREAELVVVMAEQQHQVVSRPADGSSSSSFPCKEGHCLCHAFASLDLKDGSSLVPWPRWLRQFAETGFVDGCDEWQSCAVVCRFSTEKEMRSFVRRLEHLLRPGMEASCFVRRSACVAWDHYCVVVYVQGGDGTLWPFSLLRELFEGDRSVDKSSWFLECAVPRSFDVWYAARQAVLHSVRMTFFVLGSRFLESVQCAARPVLVREAW